ncbi:hypothetical protein [Burkholderia sp. Ac-20365]|uniref:hypothetical protein n=1 Tax=Burkholderia sp. Ac-20365 TaxID=2703897 RepID=UPI00197BEF69|nr:hypothetical protein [Burkholderia sp. Ac-20365]MBN3762447.1 hypothetical protein [Burkholderia sp. Ac-20365]
MKDIDCSKLRCHGAIHTIVIHPVTTDAESRTRRRGTGGRGARSSTQASRVAASLVAGSLPWLVAQLEPGESLLRANAGESARRACLRAIDAVSLRAPARKFDLSLWYAVHHTGRGETFRMLKLKRRV